MRLVSSNVLSFCRRSSFCLVRVLISVQVICFSWKTAGSLAGRRGRREELVQGVPMGELKREEGRKRWAEGGFREEADWKAGQEPRLLGVPRGEKGRRARRG